MIILLCFHFREWLRGCGVQVIHKDVYLNFVNLMMFHVSLPFKGNKKIWGHVYKGNFKK